jgi:hypothetical protein
MLLSVGKYFVGQIRQIEWLVDRLACIYTMGLDNPWYSLREGVQENGSQLLILAEDETIFMPIDCSASSKSQNSKLLSDAGESASR